MKKSIAKKVLAIALAGCMILSVGCGSTIEPVKNTDDTAKTEEKTETKEAEDTGKEEQSGEIISAKDSLVIRQGADPGTIDWHFNTADNATRIRSLVTNSLLETERDEQGNIIFNVGDESLATEYSFDDDFMGISFLLRDNVKFSNDTEMKADDVIFSIQLFSDISGFDFIDFSNITSEDGKTVHIPFLSKNATALYQLGIMIPVYSKLHYDELGGAEGVADFYSTKAVGTGQYKIVDWVSGDYIAMEANENYFAGAPSIKNVKIRVITETSVAMMELETGGVDIVVDPGTTDVKNILGSASKDVIDCWEAPGSTAHILGFNCAGPLGEIRLREAICYAIDRDAITKAAYDISADTSSSIVSNSFEGIQDLSGSWPYTYDPEKAASLREEAGFKEGELNLTYIVGANDATRTAVGEMMVSYLAAVGINMTIVTVDRAAFTSSLEEEKGWDIHLRSWGGAGTSYLTYLDTSMPQTSHISKTENGKAMLEGVAAIKQSMDEKERLSLWKDFQSTYLTDYLYTYPLSQVKDYTLANAKLKGVEKVSYLKLSLKDAYFTE